MEPYAAPVPDTVPGAVVVHTETLEELVGRGGAVLVDVLPAPRRPEAMRPGSPWLPQAHAAIPGSLWWPEAGLGVQSPGMAAEMRSRLTALGDRLVVFYCRPDCWLSWNATRRAAAMGARAAWYPEGITDWVAAGLPTEDVQPSPLD